MKCNNKVSQFVPKGDSYKEIQSPCGSTGIHGEWLICEECESNPDIFFPCLKAERERIQRNADEDNAWLASAGLGEM